MIKITISAGPVPAKELGTIRIRRADGRIDDVSLGQLDFQGDKTIATLYPGDEVISHIAAFADSGGPVKVGRVTFGNEKI